MKLISMEIYRFFAVFVTIIMVEVHFDQFAPDGFVTVSLCLKLDRLFGRVR